MHAEMAVQILLIRDNVLVSLLGLRNLAAMSDGV